MRWRLIARATGVAIAPFTGLAGLFLVMPDYLGAPGIVSRGYGLLGAFLLYCAMASLLGGTLNVSAKKPLALALFMAVLGMPQMFCGAINVALAIQCVLHGRYWFALLAIAGAGCILSNFRERDGGATALDEYRLSPQSGHAPPFVEIGHDAWDVAKITTPLILGTLSGPVAIAVFYVLKALLLGPRPMTNGEFWSQLVAGQGFAWTLLALAVWVPATVLVAGIVQHVRLWGATEGDRDLSKQELVQVRAATAATMAYAPNAVSSSGDRIMPLATMAAYGAVIGVGALAIWGYSLSASQQTDIGDVWFRADTDRTLAIVAGVAAGMLAIFGGLPRAILARLWSRYAAWAGWNRITNPRFADLLRPGVKKFAEDGTSVALIERLVLLMRRRELADPFDAAVFLRGEGRRVPRLFAVILFVAGVGCAYAVAHDWTKADVIDKNGITITDDWTLLPRHYGFKQIRAQTIRCELYGKGNYSYAIVLGLPNGDSIDMADGTYAGYYIDYMERLNEILKRQKTPVQFEKDAHGKPLYSTACVLLVATQVDKVDQDRMTRILHLADWQRLVGKP